MSETWTIGRLLGWTADYLKERGVEGPRLDAEVLLAEACGCQRIDLYARFNDEATDTVRTAFRELVRRRAEGMPVAYLVGRREFYSMPFRVTPDVLIPRPETELLVVAVLDRLKDKAAAHKEKLFRVADVGTGSGAIAVAVAKHFPAAEVTAIDTSAKALEIAAANAAAHGVADRVKPVESDLFAAVSPSERFDIVASNPPYVSESEYVALARDVREHEPRMALVAGAKGTEVIERLIPQAAQRLNPGGWLLMEISPMIRESVEKLLVAQTDLEPAPTIKDLAGLARVVQARKR